LRDKIVAGTAHQLLPQVLVQRRTTLDHHVIEARAQLLLAQRLRRLGTEHPRRVSAPSNLGNQRAQTSAGRCHAQRRCHRRLPDAPLPVTTTSLLVLSTDAVSNFGVMTACHRLGR